MFKKIYIKKKIRTNVEHIPPRKDISIVGIVYNSKLSPNYSVISNGFHNINIINKTILLNCSNVEYDIKSLSHNLISLSHKCDFMIVIDIQTIPIRILDNISKRCRIMFFSFEENIEEIPRKSYTARFLSRFHYRASSSYNTCEIIAERCDSPIYHIYNGINTKIFFPITVKKLYDIGFVGDRNREVDETLTYLREKEIKIKAVGKGFSISNPSDEEQKILYGQSHLVLDLNGKEITSNIWNSLACKSFLIIKKIDDIENLSHGLIPNIHFVEFQSHIELINQINYYKFDKTKREQIKTAGYEFIEENRTWSHFTKEIIQIATSETGVIEISEAGEVFKVPNRLLLGTIKQSDGSRRKRKIADVSSIHYTSAYYNMIDEPSVESKISIEFDRPLSIVIPYMHNSERFPLLVECLKTLPDPRNSKNVEICIHEVGKSRVLSPEFVKNFKYYFTKFEKAFDRAWVINTGVKKLATGERLLIIDSDLIVTPQWLKEINSNKNEVNIAWGQLYCLTQQETDIYLKTHQIIEGKGRTKWPSLGGSSGAATLIDRKIFDTVKGIPEDFSGTWGGEDNAFLSKLKELGFSHGTFSNKIYHLYHKHTTPTNREVIRKSLPILRWEKKQWQERLSEIGDNWGKGNQMRKKILLMADVKSWAWGIKSRYIKEYLDDEFDIEIRYLNDGDSIPKEDIYELYHTYSTYQLPQIIKLPMRKIITGVSSLGDYKRSQKTNFKNRCIAFHANNVEIYNLAKGKLHNRIYYLPNGVDTNLFKAKYKKPQSNKFVVGFVGKPNKGKGYQNFIIPSAKAAGVILKTNINKWRTAINHKKMPDFYDNIDVYIVASGEEGTPNPALEAAACGKPIISTKVGNMPEFIEHGKNGFLVNRNINDFVNRIKQLKSDPDKCLEMGKAARKTAEQHWSWEKQSENYRKMFRELC